MYKFCMISQYHSHKSLSFFFLSLTFNFSFFFQMRLDESEIQVVDPVSLNYNIIATHDTFKNLEIRIYVYIT